MEAENFTDENALEIFPKVNSVSRGQSCKSPLKPVNDGQRLGGNPKFQQDTTPTKSSSPYTFIRQLDSAERWIERTSIVTKQDHAENVDNARNILGDLINTLPIDSQTNNWVSDALKTETQSMKSSVKSGCIEDGPVSEPTTTGNYSELDELADLLGGLDIDTSLLSDPSKTKNEREEPKTGEVAADNKDADDSWHSAVEEEEGLDIKNSLDTDLKPDTVSDYQSQVSALEVEEAQNVDEHPFKPRMQIANSPKSHHENFDKSQMLESKNKDHILQLGAHSPFTQMSDTVKACEEIPMDLFTAKSQLMNSPENQKTSTTMEKQETGMLCQDRIPVVDSSKAELENSPDTKIKACELPEKFCAVNNMDNPFKSKNQLVNSPVSQISPEEKVGSDLIAPVITHDLSKSDSELSSDVQIIQKNNSDSVIDPFRPKSQIINSPIDRKEENIVTDNELVSDPFIPETQLMNSPVKTEKAHEGVEKLDASDNLLNPLPSEKQLINSPLWEKEKGDPKARCGSDDTVTTDDPFIKSNNLISNSPVIESKQLDSSEKVFDTTIDPFKPRSQIMNSPTSNVPLEGGLIGDQFKPQTQLTNSPSAESKGRDTTEKVCSPQKDSLKPACQLANSSVTESLDCQPVERFNNSIQSSDSDQPRCPSPLKSVSAINSVNEKDTDPFKPKSQIVNSPIHVNEPKGSDSNSGLNDADPFRPKAQLMNSPAHGEADPFKPKAQLMNSPAHDEADPFKPKAQLMNSSAHNEADPFKPKAQLMNSPVHDEADPFKPKAQLMNSPAHDEADPFKPKAQLMNSPAHDEADPFKPKAQLINSPAHDDAERETDSGCTATEKPAKSNTSFETVGNPFEKRGQLANSPHATTDGPNTKSGSENKESIEEQSELPKALLTENVLNKNSPEQRNLSANVDSPQKTHLDLLSSLVKISSDVQTNLETASSTPKEKLISSKTTVKSASNVPDQVISSTETLSHNPANIPTEGNESDVLMKTEETKLSFTGPSGETSDNTTTEQNEVDFGESEEFIPATQAFNDPAFFEMLEKSNTSLSNNKQRGSLLLKFDPLQERRDTYFAKPASPGPTPIQKSSRVSEVCKDTRNSVSFVEDSICLFGTPPRVARRRTLTRKVHRGRAESIEEETAAKEVDMILGLDEDCDGMDKILCDNLHPSDNAGAKLVEIGEMPVYTESEMKEIRGKLTMYFQEMLLRKEKDFQERLNKQEEVAAQEKAKMVAETETLKHKVKSLNGKLHSFGEIIKEYTDITAQASAEKDAALASKADVVAKMEKLNELNSQIREDNKTLEKSFDDLFHRYEKVKQAFETSKENEKVLKQAIETAQEKYKKNVETSRKTKEMSETKLAELDEKYEKLKNSSKDEVMRLELAVKRKDLQIQGLEASLEQKKTENKELTDLCDSLINKVSS